MIPLVLLLSSCSVLPAWSAAETAAALMPPPQPRHEQRMVDTPGALARDLAEVVSFLEQGQAYFRAFKKGSHSAEENAALLRFLEAYEKERDIARREADLLSTWMKTRSDLEPPAENPTPAPKNP